MQVAGAPRWGPSKRRSISTAVAEYAVLQPAVAERPPRVEQRDESGKIGQAFVQTTDGIRAREEKLAPMRPRVKRREGRLDGAERRLHVLLAAFPGEMNGHGVLVILR